MRSLLPVCVLLLGASTALQADIGRVKSASGAAHIERASEQIAAQPGLTLLESDVLVTGRDGALGVTFADNTRFSAGPNSRIELARFRFNPTTHEGSFETRVSKGSLAVISGQIAKTGGDAMRVRTPSTILGVRGTEFIVDVDS